MFIKGDWLLQALKWFPNIVSQLQNITDPSAKSSAGWKYMYSNEPRLSRTELAEMEGNFCCELFVLLFVKGSCQARGRSRAGECWSWWPCCTWLFCWAALPSSTSPLVSSWLSPWCLWLHSSRRTYQSNADSLAIAPLYCHLLVKPHFLFLLQLGF